MTGRINFATKANRRLRAEVYLRDGYACQVCGLVATEPEDYDGTFTLMVDHEAVGRSYLVIDHVRPRSRGGANAIENLQTLCQPCNSRKCDREAAA